MAIKGKKKPQRRGAQGSRRPAAAPRPAPAARRKTPWYRTRDGMLILGVFLVVLMGVGIWLVASARERAAATEARRDSLDRYTSQIQSALTGATTPVTEMNLAATPPRGADVDELAGNTDGWIEALRAAQTEVVQIFPEREIEPVNQLFNEALSLYISSAQTFALLPDVRGETRQQLFSRAADQRDTATALWASAIGVLDQMRRDLDLRGSGLQAPSAPAPAPQAPEGEEVEVPVEPEAPEGEAPEDEAGEGPDENDDGTTEEEDPGGD